MKKTKAPAPWSEYSADFKPLEVKVGSNFEKSLKDFKSMVQKSKILSTYKEKQSYEKPSEKKRRKKREAEERNRLLLLKEKQIASGEWDRRQKVRDQKNKKRYRDEQSSEMYD